MINSIIGIAFDCKDADRLADFYARLLGWEKTLSGDGWAGIHSPQGIILAFQTVPEYQPPVWPWKDGEQQQMAHIDFKAEDLEKAVIHALECGAVKAEIQYYDTSTVMIDPEGHPFCLSSVQQ
jgi:predicted enzyme related to lactoylglutathione lyase